jgi:hypothetical protein
MQIFTDTNHLLVDGQKIRFTNLSVKIPAICGKTNMSFY